MKKLWIVLLYIGWTQLGISQCPTSTVTLLTQEDVNNFSIEFPNCDSLSWDLRIGDSAVADSLTIIDLSPLNQLIYLDSLLTIRQHAAITNLKGLQQLKRIGSIYIFGNSTLKTVADLDSLREILGYIIITRNSVLEEISFPNSITKIDSFCTIRENPALTILFPSSQIKQIRGPISLKENNALQTIEGFEQLTFIEEDFTIEDNPKLRSLKGLENIQSIGGDFSVSNNQQLSRLVPSGQLKEVGNNILIKGNPNLLQLEGLEQLERVGKSLEIIRNEKLRDLSQLSQVRRVGDFLRIDYNSALVSLAGLEQLESVGYLLIKGLPELSDLSGLESLDSIHRNLALIENTGLVDLEGLEQLQYLGKSITLHDNPMLNNLLALRGVNSYGLGGLYLQNNARLRSLEGLEFLNALSNCFIQDHPLLVNLKGLDNLTTSSGGSGSFILRNCQNLKTVEGLEKLSLIKGSLIVEECPVLEDLSGLRNLQIVDSRFLIINNISLSSLSAMSHLERIGHKVIIQDNPLLSTCEIRGVCGFLNNTLNFNSFTSIYNNSDGCNSPTEVRDACNPVSTQQVSNEEFHFSVLPNPSSGLFQFDSPQVIKGQLRIFDVYGHLIRQTKFNTNTPIDLRSQADGIYLLEFFIGKTLLRKKVVKNTGS